MSMNPRNRNWTATLMKYQPYMRLLRGADAEDLLQDVALSLHKSDSCTDQIPPGIIVNKIRQKNIDTSRKQGRQVNCEPLCDNQFIQRVDPKQNEFEVRDVLSLLSPEIQSVWRLKVFGGYTHGEIAAILGRKPDAVKRLYKRGRSQLKNILRNTTENCDEQRYRARRVAHIPE